jgi:microcystin-dependent protein
MSVTEQAVPGTVIPSGSLVSPGGGQGVQGIQGPAGSLAVGTVILYVAGGTPPASWMTCDGSAVSRTTYPDLFTAIGTTYGAGDGSTTFNLPDLRGRTAIGVGQGTGLTNRILAASGGEETHQLTIAELASHTHTITVNPHNHTLDLWWLSGTTSAGGGANWSTAYSAGAGYTQNATATASAANTGSGTAHNTMQPFLVLSYIIKVSVSGGATAQAPIADSTQDGLLRKVSGNLSDYVGGDNTCHDLMSAVATLLMPPGIILDFGGSTAPNGFLFCDGSAVSRTTYSTLYGVIGTTYGTGDGSTTFNVPDCRGRTSIGVGQGTGLTNRVLASTGGEERHTHIIAELPAHNHPMSETAHNHSQNAHNHALNDGGHLHAIQGNGTGYASGALGSYTFALTGSAPNGSQGAGTGCTIANNTPTNNAASTGITTQNTGSATPFNVLQPFVTFNKIIKT